MTRMFVSLPRESGRLSRLLVPPGPLGTHVPPASWLLCEP